MQGLRRLRQALHLWKAADGYVASLLTIVSNTNLLHKFMQHQEKLCLRCISFGCSRELFFFFFMPLDDRTKVLVAAGAVALAYLVLRRRRDPDDINVIGTRHQSKRRQTVCNNLRGEGRAIANP